MQNEIEKHPEFNHLLDQVDGVVFDYGGVIAKNPKDAWGVFPLCAALSLSPEKVKEGMRRYRNRFDGGEMDCHELYRKIFRDNNLEIPTDDKLDKIVYEDGIGWAQMCASTLRLMKELKARGKKIGILTNMSVEFFYGYFSRLGTEYRAVADAETISGLEKLYKPKRPIYDLTARRMGIDPSRLLFLDDLEENVAGAKAAGWQAAVFIMRDTE